MGFVGGDLPVTWKQKLKLRMINWYPPICAAGIRVKKMDGQTIRVTLRRRFWNANMMGTHYGGSLYSMCDPFFTLILMQNLGDDYIVWDKAACIEFLKPVKENVYAVFHIPQENIRKIAEEVKEKNKTLVTFYVTIYNTKEEEVARVEKVIYVRNRGKLPLMH